jgi:hypothetical protein
MIRCEACHSQVAAVIDVVTADLLVELFPKHLAALGISQFGFRTSTTNEREFPGR